MDSDKENRSLPVLGVKARNEALGINAGHNVTGGGGRDHHCSCNQCIQKELNNKAEEINR